MSEALIEFSQSLFGQSQQGFADQLDLRLPRPCRLLRTTLETCELADGL